MKFGQISQWYEDFLPLDQLIVMHCSCFHFQLVVHVGVNAKTSKICLERNAFNGQFSDADFSNQVLSNCNVTLPNAGAQCQQLCTSLNVDSIIEEVDMNTTMMQCSDNPGK